MLLCCPSFGEISSVAFVIPGVVKYGVLSSVIMVSLLGLEVKAKVPSKVSLGGGSLVHISQVTLGPGGLSDLKKDNETVMVHVKVGEKKLVLAILSKDTPQRSFDLVFDEDFEISHNWKNGDVHLLGYQNESVDLYP
ncbi:hypothetical protein KSS87_014479 [Heliosperma pusillum]|nr:hypothetical protein KSS87_008872 [Heliosperma pusillum]KAH9606164.1 hypothetical protein KSS87_014479 [Heliosperma pusillum]